MIIDSFTFFNELDLLEKRFEYLYDTVDLFLIVEADHTFVGKPKPLNFLKNQTRFKKYLDKVLYCPYKVDLSKYDLSKIGKEEFFLIEIDQRNYIGEMLKFFPNDSLVMLSDLDEIPLKYKMIEAITGLRENNFETIVLICEMFYYNFNQKQVFEWWGPIICYNSYIQKVGTQWARSSRVYNAGVYNAGYHLGYWGDAAAIKNKIENFAHQEFNKEEYTNLEKIQEKIDNCIDIFGRTADFNQLIKVDKNTIDVEIYRIFSSKEGK